MGRRVLLLSLACLAAASSASAAWHPRFDEGYVRVLVGETRTVAVHAVWTGIWIVPWQPWVFYSTNPNVARVEGRMDSSRTGYPEITGVKPGSAQLQIEGWSEYYKVYIDVACGQEDPVQAAVGELDIRVGESVQLHAVTPIAWRTTFQWYRGRTGDTSRPLSALGPKATFTPQETGTEYAWVLATTPCSSSTAEFAIDVHGLRRRMVRH